MTKHSLPLNAKEVMTDIFLNRSGGLVENPLQSVENEDLSQKMASPQLKIRERAAKFAVE